MGKSYSLGRTERLKRRKVIERLFSGGKPIHISGFKLIYSVEALETNFPAQVCFAVPKKKIPKAVDRNRIKRLMRESYRLNKAIHYQHLEKIEKQVAIIIIYNFNEVRKFEEISNKIILILGRLVKELNSTK